jgi:hypothetical protein
MTIIFHRLTVPSYFGGLPVNYDYINNAVSGTPAFANPQLSAGPNIGSYFVGFQDDGTSADANRSAQALATNTDYLDNVVHNALAYVTKTNNVTPGAPVPSVTLTGPGIFLGISGTTPLTELFEVTDANDNAVEVGGTPVQVASITGGTVGSGFSAGNVTITFNISIPSGQTYRIYYGTASNLATLPADAFFAARLGQRSDDADFLDFVKQVSAPGTMPGDVSALVATVFQTPDGTRLPQSHLMNFSLDPFDSGASTRTFSFLTRSDSTPLTLMQLIDDPTSLFYAGLTSLALMQGSGVAGIGGANATIAFLDGNTIGAAPANFVPAIPFSSVTATKGDQFLRTLENLPTSGTPGTLPESMLQRLNAPWACTVGDGDATFGDFNGAGGIEAALNYYLNFSTSTTVAYIQVKPGSYTFTQHWPIQGTVIIEGLTSLGGSVGVQDTLTGDSVFGLSSSNLILKGMSVYNEHATQTFIDGEAGSTIVLDKVSIANLQVILDTPGAMPNGMAFIANECDFIANATGTRLLYLSVGDGFQHSGYFFNKCNWNCSDHTIPVTLAASNSPGGTMSGIVFQDCTYTLGGTTTTSGCFTENTGILDVNPGTSGSFNFHVTDVTWTRCTATSNSLVANGPVMCLMPVAVGASSVTNITDLGILTMEDCTWAAQGGPSAISPFFVCARKIVMHNVNFRGTGSNGNAQGSDMATALATTTATADWGQITIASSFWLLNQGLGDVGLDLDNVSFSTFRQLSDSCDVRIEAPPFYGTIQAPTNSIKNLRFSQYIQGGLGAAPNYRVNFDTMAALAGLPASTVVEQVSLQGTTGHLTDLWASNGIIGIQPQSGFEMRRSGPVDSGFAPASGLNEETGIYINYGTGAEVYDLTLIDCFGNGFGFGLYVPPGNSGNEPLDGLNIVRGHYSFNNINGVFLGANNVGNIHVEDVITQENTNVGIEINIPNTAAQPTANLVLHGNSCVGNDSGATHPAGIAIITANTTTFPGMSVTGNSVLNISGALDNIRIAKSGGSSAFPSPSGYPMLGIETGLNAFGSDPTNGLQSVSGKATIMNQALLLTPGP